MHERSFFRRRSLLGPMTGSELAEAEAEAVEKSDSKAVKWDVEESKANSPHRNLTEPTIERATTTEEFAREPRIQADARLLLKGGSQLGQSTSAPLLPLQRASLEGRTPSEASPTSARKHTWPSQQQQSDPVIVPRVGVQCFASFKDAVFQGNASGEIQVVSFANEVLKTAHVPAIIACACTVGASVWMGVGSSIFSAMFSDGGLSVRLVVEHAHRHDDAVRFIVYAGAHEVWSATENGHICLWDEVTGEKRQTLLLGESVTLHSMCAVEMHGVLTVWMGCVDEIRVMDCVTRTLRSILPLPRSGAVTCIANVAIDVVWTGSVSQDGKGSLHLWDASL